MTTEKTTVAALIKRGTPSAWPHELTLATDPNDPLCDAERMDLPVMDERVVNFAVRGQLQPILVRARGDEIVVVAGRQRWKRATVINHLVGIHLYRGSLASVRDAIDRLSGSDAGKRIVELCPKGMKLQFTLHRGSEAEAAGSVVSENEQRDGDAKAAKVRRAQRLARQGFTAEDQAEDAGVSAATIKRWIATDLDKRTAPKKRGKATRPGVKKIAAMLDRLQASTESWSNMSMCVRDILRWTLGHISDAQLVSEVFPLAIATTTLGEPTSGTADHAEAAE